VFAGPFSIPAKVTDAKKPAVTPPLMLTVNP